MKDSELNYSTFFPHLLVELPEFRPDYEKHVNDFNEVLPYVLMDEFYRFLVESYQRSRSDTNDPDLWQQVVTRSVDLLERGLDSSDENLRQLVLSFLENLDPREAEYNDIKSLLYRGSKLREALELYYSDYG